MCIDGSRTSEQLNDAPRHAFVFCCNVVHGKSPRSGGSYRNELGGDVTPFSVYWPIARAHQCEQFASPRGKRIIPWWRRK